jgi:hypothetical protein
MTEWKTVKAELDIDTYIAELAPSGALSLTNDHVKEELDLSPSGSYDLLVFLHQHAAQIYHSMCIATVTSSGPRDQIGKVDHRTTSGCSTMTWRTRSNSA